MKNVCSIYECGEPWQQHTLHKNFSLNSNKYLRFSMKYDIINTNTKVKGDRIYGKT